MSTFRRLIALAGVLGMFSVGLAATPAALVATAAAAGGGGCGSGGGGGGPVGGPTEVFASHFSGLSATASFTSFSGTTETDAFIDAFDGTVSLAGSGPTSISAVFVGITVSDPVNGITVQAFGCAPNPDFQIDHALTSATLAPTSVTLFDYVSNGSPAATVSGDWTGVGDVTRTTQISTFHSGAFTEVFDIVGSSRGADATGTIGSSDLGVSLGGPASYAELDNVDAGGVSVCLRSSC